MYTTTIAQSHVASPHKLIPNRIMLLMIGILLIAFSIRTFELDHIDIEGDEAFSFAFSIDSLEGILRTTLTIAEPHPVASYFINHFWLEYAGRSLFAFRYESVLYGVAVAALIYRLGRRLNLAYHGNKQLIPTIAAILVALSPFMIEESRNGRMYSLSLMLTLLSTWLALELWSGFAVTQVRNQWTLHDSKRLLKQALTPRATQIMIAYIFVSYLALNTHYFTGTILLAQNVSVLIALSVAPMRSKLHRAWAPGLTRWVICQCVILLAFTPWYLLVHDILRTYIGASYYSPSAELMLRLISGVYMVGFSAPGARTVFALIGGVVMLAGVMRLVLYGKEQRLNAVVLLVLFVVPITLSFLDSRGRSTFAERQVIATATPYYLLIAAAIAPVWSAYRNRFHSALNIVLPIVMACGMVAGLGTGLQGFLVTSRNTPSSWGAFVRIVSAFSANIAPDQIRVAQNEPEPAMTFYYSDYPAAINLPARAADLQGAIKDVQALADAGVERVILREDAGHWWNGGKGKDYANDALSTQFTLVDRIFTGRWWVFIYSRTTAEDLRPVGIKFSNGLELHSAMTRAMNVMKTSINGKVLEVHLLWDTSRMKRTGSEKIFIHIMDQNNQVPSQLDLPLSDADLHVPIKTYGVPIANDMKPGKYVVRIGLYDPALSGAPRLRTNHNDDGIEIATLTIDE